jgi:predicted lysophospholipase L1 biosynthesis ABC-type transport system permease subunit
MSQMNKYTLGAANEILICDNLALLKVEQALSDTYSALRRGSWRNAEASLMVMYDQSTTAKNEAESSPCILGHQIQKWAAFADLMQSILNSFETIKMLDTEMMAKKQTRVADQLQCAVELYTGIERIVEQEIIPNLMQLFCIEGQIELQSQPYFTQQKL